MAEKYNPANNYIPVINKANISSKLSISVRKKIHVKCLKNIYKTDIIINISHLSYIKTLYITNIQQTQPSPPKNSNKVPTIISFGIKRRCLTM